MPGGQIQASQPLTSVVLFKRCLGSQVHGKLNTHTGDAHGIAQLKRKFFPEVCESSVGFMLETTFCVRQLQAAGRIDCLLASDLSLCIWLSLLQLLTSLDVGAKFDSQLKEFTYDVQGKKTLPVTDNGLLSVDLKGGYNYNPGTRKVGGLHPFDVISFCIYKISND